MQTTRDSRKADARTGVRRVSLDVTDPNEVLDRKMREAIERIERVRSMALLAVGRLLVER